MHRCGNYTYTRAASESTAHCNQTNDLYSVHLLFTCSAIQVCVTTELNCSDLKCLFSRQKKEQDIRPDGRHNTTRPCRRLLITYTLYTQRFYIYVYIANSESFHTLYLTDLCAFKHWIQDVTDRQTNVGKSLRFRRWNVFKDFKEVLNEPRIVLFLVWCKSIHLIDLFLTEIYTNKKAQLSLTNPRDAKACRNCFNSACLQRCRWQYWPSFMRLTAIASEIHEIQRNSLKIPTYGVQGHRRSPILVPIESPYVTCY